MNFDDTGAGTQSFRTAAYLLLPLLFLILILPVSPLSNQTFIPESHDATVMMLPDLHLAEHPLALWNNQWLTGFSESGSLNTDRFYPFSFPLVFFTKDIFIINFIFFVNLYIAFLAFWKLGSYLVKNEELLFLFSTTYMLSGVLISRVSVGHISFVYAMAWIPLIYYFAFRLMHSKDLSVVAIAGLGICETILLFTGGMYYLFFCNAILFVFFLYYSLTSQISRASLIAICGSAGLFLTLGAIKFIPNFFGMSFIQRLDPINPLGDGGLLENNLASFTFGTPIDSVFGPYETMALIGGVLVIFAIIALIWGERTITAPSFWAIIFSFIWADGGRILLSFIHLLPLLNSFRNAGRIFGAIMPVVLLLSLYGVYIVQDKLRKGEPFLVSPEQKRMIVIGGGVLVFLKILELPWITMPTPEAALAVVLVFGFIALIYLNKLTPVTLLGYLAGTLLITAVILSKDFSILNTDIFIKGILFTILLAGTILLFTRNTINRKPEPGTVISCLLVIAIILSAMTNISVLKPSDPKFIDSPARDVVEKILESPTNAPKIWVFENGWSFQHIDFTYWFIKNGIHPMRGYFSYVPKNPTPLAIMLNGTQYFTADYLVDTAYLENGNQNLPDVSYKVDNISVYRPEYVLPVAFVIRGEGTLVPATIRAYSSDEIIISGAFRQGDVALIKTAYYPGWKINGADTAMVINMPAAKLETDTDTITFRYDPLDVKAGIALSVVGIIALIVLLVKRKEAERMLSEMNRVSDKPAPRKRKKENRV